MPIQAPQWTEFLTCPVCCNEFDSNNRSPISLACSHTICRACLANLHKKQCPFDQTQIKTEVSGLPVNGALLQLVTGQGHTGDLPPCLAHLCQAERDAYLRARTAIEQLALYLKPFSSVGGSGAVSRPMQRKLVTLVNCQLAEEEGRCRAMRAARSLGDRTVTELILYHQNPGHLSANLWAAVRARGCQFLGPAMQEEVLKLVLLALEDGTALSRKVLVMFVVQRLEPHFPQASKTSIGHVVQLLYRASCFKVSKREGDSSLMQLKEEFRSYEALRREHDAQIVQIATEAGLRIAPDQWSALLYGDSAHKSHMQSIMDKLQSPGSFGQSVQELVIALQRSGDPGCLASLRPHLEHLAAIDPNPEVCTYNLQEVADGVESCRTVVAGLVEFMRSHGGGGVGGKGSPGEHGKYKVSLCRDLALRGSCPRGPNCTFAHSDDELDKFRSKNRKSNRSSCVKEDDHQHEDIIYCNEGNTDYAAYSSVTQNAAFATSQHTSFQQPSSTQFPSDIYNSPRHGNVMVRTPFPQPPPQPPEPKAAIWRRQPHFNNSKRGVASSLAVLQHRKQELLNQLERVVARCNNNPIPQDVQSGPTNFAVWNSTNVIPNSSPLLEQSLISQHRPLLYRSDSGLTEEEFIPFDPPIVSKFGPISREGTKPPSFNEPPPQIAWLFNSPHGGYLGDIVQPMRDGFIAVDLYRPNTQDVPPTSDFLVESQKMKLQLRTLEKKINDLKLATEGSAALSEGEKLSQELHLIEQGIREREHQLRMNQLSVGGSKPVWNGENWPSFRPEEIGIIGGSGLNKPGILEGGTERVVETPFGLPSDVLIEGQISGVDCVLLARHGREHTINPSNINYRANIWALKDVGCTHVIVSSATGSLQEHIKPGDLVIVDSFIDRTFKRENTFHDGSAKSPFKDVVHMPMEPAFCSKTRSLLLETARGLGLPVHEGGSVVTIEGPRFSSKAESNTFRLQGASLVNMTLVPEVCLAREVGLLYAAVAMATDYDCWRCGSVNVVEVLKTLRANAKKVEKLFLAVIPKIAEQNWDNEIQCMKDIFKYSNQTQICKLSDAELEVL